MSTWTEFVSGRLPELMSSRRLSDIVHKKLTGQRRLKTSFGRPKDVSVLVFKSRVCQCQSFIVFWTSFIFKTSQVYLSGYINTSLLWDV